LDSIFPYAKKLNERYADLLGADIAIKNREIIASRNNIFGLPEILVGTGAGYAGGPSVGVGTALAYKALSSTLGKTIAAKALSKGVKPVADIVAGMKTYNPNISPVALPASIGRMSTQNTNQK
jgi:hypothetical protein